MVSRRARLVTVAVAALLAALFLWPERSIPPIPAASFAFAVLGDAPYTIFDGRKFTRVIREIDAQDVDFSIHVGDIFWRPCGDDHYREMLDVYAHMRRPLVYTPGDNEWFDCWERDSGSFAPLERLAALRRIFFSTPTHSLGSAPLTLDTQAASADFPDFPENARWVSHGVQFATVHVIGSFNGGKAFPTRTPADDDAMRRRTSAAVAWLRDSFARARQTGAPALVLAFHAALEFDSPQKPYRSAVDQAATDTARSFLDALATESARFPGLVVLVHGDDHEFVVDHPLRDPQTGAVLQNVTRLMVPGSPDVGWVRVDVTPGETPRFAFHSRIMRWWKYF